jgi:hypothetical protein
MKRKDYIRPTTETVEVDSPTILAGSLGSDDTPNVNFTDIPADDTGLTAD